MKRNIQYSIFNIPNSARSRGFTVIELLVTMAIFSVLTGVVLARYRDYTTNASFANASESIVLALRQAQVYGAGGKNNDASCEGSLYMCHYGVSFINGSNKFTMFIDINNNQIFNDGDTVLETISLGDLTTVSGLICGSISCSSANGLNVVFIRPYTDAWIADVANVLGTPSSYDSGTITITNGEKSSMVTISRAGQISIEQI